MKRLPQPVLFAGALGVALCLTCATALGAAPRTISGSNERARVSWNHYEADGTRCYVVVHQCEERTIDSATTHGNGFALCNRHLRIEMVKISPQDGEVYRGDFLTEGTPISLGTGLRSARLHGSGSGTYTYLDDGVTRERAARFYVDLRVSGTGPITSWTDVWTSGPDVDGLWWDNTTTMWLRDATFRGVVTMDGVSCVSDLPYEAKADMRHQDFEYVLVPEPE